MDNVLYEMDFSIGRDGVYEDEGFGAWESKVTTLPLFVLTDDDYSVFGSLHISRAIVTLEGFPEFDIMIEPSNGDSTVTQTINRTGLGISGAAYHSGPVGIPSIPQNGSPAPKISLVNNNNRYISFSGCVLDLGKSGGSGY